MTQLTIDIPEGMSRIIGAEKLERPETQSMLRRAVVEKLKVLMLSDVVDGILKKSKLTDDQAALLADEANIAVARKHGIAC